MNIERFLAEVSSIYQTGVATEHSYRNALQNLLSSTGEDITELAPISTGHLGLTKEA